MLDDAQPLQFGPIALPNSAAVNHFLFVGTTGSGKTTLLRLLMQSALQSVGMGGDVRAMAYDAKRDLVPQFTAIAPRAELLITNPFDERSVAWDLYKDIQEPQVAIEFTYNIIPQVPESQPFFSDAARHLILGVILSFMRTGVEWSLADLLCATQSPKKLKGVLRKHAETRDLISLYLYDKRLAANIISTIATKFLPFGPVAAAWEHAKRRVSLATWARSEMIWILGCSEISRTSMQVLNRCMVKRAIDLTLDADESRTRRNWFIIDELADVGRLEGLVSLAKKARSKGGCLAFAFQSVAGLRDPQMYGPHFSEELLAQFAHKSIGRLECAASAEWTSKLVGDHEIEQASSSSTYSMQGGWSSTESRQNVVKPGILPSQLMDFPPCNLHNGLTGLFFAPTTGPFTAAIDGEELFHDWLMPPADVPAFLPRSTECQWLRPWTDARAALFSHAQVRRAPETIQPQLGLEMRQQADLDDLFQ